MFQMKPPIEAATELQGTVERVTFYNPQNGYSVVKLRVRGRRTPIAAVGTLPAVQPGERLLLAGRWQTDPRHGSQFCVETATVQPPSALGDIVRYLGSGLIRQLGPVLAQRIVACFGERTLEVLDSSPERVREVPGVGPQRARALAAAWAEHRALRDVMAFLSEHHLDTRYAARLVATYSRDAPRVLRANPYRLVAEVPGIGFAAADRLGRDLGIRATAVTRLQAAVHAAALRTVEQGHTRVPHQELTASAVELADVPADLIESAVTQLLAGGVLSEGRAAGSGDITPEPISIEAIRSSATNAGRLRIYEPPRQESPPVPSPDLGLEGLVRAEESLAARIGFLANQPVRASAARVDAWLAADDGARLLSDEQRAAVRTAALSPCFVLSGGPGVGKTTAVRTLVRCLQTLERSVALAAPTGKAAKRLGEVTGVEARTLHRLLGAGPNGFRYGARQPLPFDTVIVDEASMLDTQLARALLAAIGERIQLVLVGDADQLPSVGPGQVLRDLLTSRVVPSATLQTIFRQAAQSRIIQNAHLIRRGELPEFGPPSALAQGIDCIFVPASAGRITEIATQWAVERLPRLSSLASDEIQVLAPLTRVCQALNGLLQERLNPPNGQAERPHGALSLRVGDRVIQTRNNYNLGVFNGDTGTILDIDSDTVSVDFGDGQTIIYAASDLLDLDHAYGLTVHRAQGSEWPGVVMLASLSHGPMLTRNLLYTALTRARRVAVVIGDEAAIARAVAETRDQDRRTGLAALLASQGTRRP